jgi:hypothetical protein
MSTTLAGILFVLSLAVALAVAYRRWATIYTLLSSLVRSTHASSAVSTAWSE